MKGFLVINADDLGMSPEVNAGVLTGLQYGFMSDTSLLVKAPFAEPAVEGLKNLGTGCAGIHIDLDELLGWRPGGYEANPRPVLMEMLQRADLVAACAREARAQIERFLSFGLMATHLDTHHHVHGFLPIFDALMGLMDEYAIPAMRFSAQGYHLPTREDIPFERGDYLRMEDALREKGVFFCGTLLEGSGKIPQVGFGVTELVVHPSRGGELWRSREMKTLQSAEGVESLMRRGIRLMSFSDLLTGVRTSS